MTDELKERNTESRRSTLAGEFLHFLKHEKKWWISPFVVIGLIVAALLLLNDSMFGSYLYAR